MRRIMLLAGLVALITSFVAPATAGAKPAPTMTATACRVDSDTIRVAVSWSRLRVTGGEIFVNTAPLETGYTRSWNQRAMTGSHSEDIDIGTDIADLVTVNLYNAKDPNNITFEQRVIGTGDNAEEIPAC